MLSSVKELWTLVDAVVVQKAAGVVTSDLEAALARNKDLLFSPLKGLLLRNPARSEADAEALRKAVDGDTSKIAKQFSNFAATIPYHRLPEQLVDEAMTVAKIFDLNEMVSLQLLLSGEERLCDHPGLTRGLVAVLLYYDMRKTLVDVLKLLLLAREGSTWAMESMAPDVVKVITDFTQQLVEQGLVTRILETLKKFDWQSEAVTLRNNLALGDAAHRNQVQELYCGYYRGLADSLFALAAQSGLRKPDALALMDHVSTVRLDESNADGSLDEITTSLLMALLYAVDFGRSTSKESEVDVAVLEELPIVKDKTFVPAIHAELVDDGGGHHHRHHHQKQWQHEGIHAVVRFAWSMSLASMRTTPSLSSPEHQPMVDDDEVVLDMALDGAVFHWMAKCILAGENSTIKSEEFYVRRFHQLLTDLVVFMPLKVKELRNKADDAARNKMMHENEGIQYSVPLACQHFEFLLLAISELYKGLVNPASYDLVLDYWCPASSSASADASLSAMNMTALFSSGRIVDSSLNRQRRVGRDAGGLADRYPARQMSLYKFVRMAGDLLMPSLYMPYVRMLCSLSAHPAAAFNCFNLLKANGQQVSSGGSTVSWDHFFASLHQYFDNLRKESHHLPTTDTIYRVRSLAAMTRGISPAEIQGLSAVLKLVAKVCSNSEVARTAVVSNADWQPVFVLVGLLSCSVPTVLKAELLNVLSAFSQSPEVATTIWKAMEDSSFLQLSGHGQLFYQNQQMMRQPIVAAAQQQTQRRYGGGYLLELETVEAKDEEYPMTTALLQLFEILVDQCHLLEQEERLHTIIMEDEGPLGAMRRALFSLVTDHIFLPLNNRAFKDPAERWSIASSCLKIMLKLLTEFEPSQAAAQIPNLLSSPKLCHAGFSLTVCLLQPSELLRLLLLTLDVGCEAIESYAPSSKKCKQDLHNSCLSVLRMFRRCLEMQPHVLRAISSSNQVNIILPGLDKLLFGINPRTGKADHVFTVAKFIGLSWSLPHHAVEAIRLLTCLSSPINQQFILSSFTLTPDGSGKTIVKGFTDIMDNGPDIELLPAYQDSTRDDVEDGDEGQLVRVTARLAALDLLQASIRFPAPSIAHFLLGFDLNGVSRSNLKPPAAPGAIRTPFHAMLELLRYSNDDNLFSGETANEAPLQGAPFMLRCPKTAEAIYRLLYSLASSPETSEPVLRYLRSSSARDDFFAGQISQLPLLKEPQTTNKGMTSCLPMNTLRAESWLLKAAAIELRAVCRSRLKSQLSLWIRLLLNPRNTTLPQSTGFGEDNESAAAYHHQRHQFYSTVSADLNHLSHVMTASTATHPRKVMMRQSHNRLLHIFNTIDFTEKSTQPPEWEIFDHTKVESVIKMCSGDGGTGRVDIRQLHQVLRQEIQGVQASIGLAQRSLLHEEVLSILKYAVDLNRADEEVDAMKNLLDSWRHITEVMLSCVPDDVLISSTKQQILLELLQTLLNKVHLDGANLELSNALSGIVLILLTSLRATYRIYSSSSSTRFVEAQQRRLEANSDRAPILDNSLVRQKGRHGSTSSSMIYPSGLQVILRGLIVWITSSSSSLQRVRVNLYGAMLNYLSIGGGGDPAEVEKADAARFFKANVEVLAGFGDVLIDTICRDTASGHDIRRILALGLLDQLIALDKQGAWMWYVSREGYLKYVIDTLASDDKELLATLAPQAIGSKIFFTYESRMAFFTRLASTLSGAQLLLESGVMIKLAEMKVFSARPELPSSAALRLRKASSYRPDQQHQQMPDTLDRYRQIFFPVLRLCLALVAKLGSDNRSAVAHVKYFVKAHESVFRAVLHPSLQHSDSLTLASLEELSLVTGILSKCAPLDESTEEMPAIGLTTADGPSSDSGIVVVGLQQLGQQMMSLVTQFDVSETFVQRAAKLVAENTVTAEFGGGRDTKAALERFVVEIVVNLHVYVRKVSLGADPWRRHNCKMVFSPSFLDVATILTAGQPSSSSMAAFGSSSTGSVPSLGQVFKSLENMCMLFIRLHAASSEACNQDDDSTLNAPENMTRDPPLSLKTHGRDHSLELLGAALEGTLWVALKHLECFCAAEKAVEKSSSASFAFTGQISPSKIIKGDAGIILNDSFFMILLDVDKLLGSLPRSGHQGFINTVVRRLKRVSGSV